MPKNKLNFNIVFKKIEKLQKDMNYLIRPEERDKYNEIRELSGIVSEIKEPEKRYLTST